jgi:Anti-sigma-K factor rskA/Putative zinc-finger
MSIDRHDIYSENVGAYLLDALTELEQRQFEEHLDECPVCRDDVERLRVAADALPRSVTPVAPPPGLKVALMKAVNSDLEEAGRSTRPSVAARLRQRVAAFSESLTQVRPGVAWVSATCVLLVGLLAGYGASEALRDGATTKPRTVAAQFDPTITRGASGSLSVADNGQEATLHVHGLKSLPPDRTYQVWLQKDGETIPKALFSVGKDGAGLTAVDGGLNDADYVMVTREPAGGSRSPGERPVMRVKL